MSVIIIKFFNHSNSCKRKNKFFRFKSSFPITFKYLRFKSNKKFYYRIGRILVPPNF